MNSANSDGFEWKRGDIETAKVGNLEGCIDGCPVGFPISVKRGNIAPDN